MNLELDSSLHAWEDIISKPRKSVATAFQSKPDFVVGRDEEVLRRPAGRYNG